MGNATSSIAIALGCVSILAGTSAPAAAQDAAVETDAPDPLVWSGDFRLRIDVDARDEDGAGDDFDDRRTRPRLRARLGVGYDTPVAGLSFGLRVATNAGTPGNSPHESFSLAEENVFELDRAFIRYAPGHGVALVAGKQGWPHWQQTEIFWDEDIQPEGFAASYARDVGTGEVGANAAYFYLANNSWEEELGLNDVLATWQLRWSGAFGDVAPTVAITGAHLQDHGEPSNVDDAVNVGDIDFFMASAQVKATVGRGVALTAGVDVVASTADEDDFAAACAAPCEDWDETLGFVGQLRAGYAAWGARYYYYAIGEASVPFYAPLGSFTQDNFPSNAASLTGFSGHRIQLDRRIGDGVAADLRLYVQSADDDNVLSFAEPATRSTTRFQLNVNAAF